MSERAKIKKITICSLWQKCDHRHRQGKNDIVNYHQNQNERFSMIVKDMMRKDVVEFFEAEYKEVLNKLDQLSEATKNLRFEGKLSYGKNIKEVEEVIKFLEKKLYQHIALDEKIIFPFVEAHIPKLEPILRFLRAERNEFKINLEVFESLFKKLKGGKMEPQQHKIVEELREKGIYLVCLMRNHIQTENESVYKTIDQQLREDEKKELLRRIKECDGCKCLN